ncbi:hypothetical protein L3Y34_016267 [Caenorhabditis briggsae]|uniref:Uncharacterized protein n=3 Tax=Caenorhabditis briggsae TaxID=6238 RepID=A0AAE9DXR3_CAEBR|nr:hypothetical protein L3Y34_016267 [Caenorhabditis briggsae]
MMDLNQINSLLSIMNSQSQSVMNQPFGSYMSQLQQPNPVQMQSNMQLYNLLLQQQSLLSQLQQPYPQGAQVVQQNLTNHNSVVQPTSSSNGAGVATGAATGATSGAAIGHVNQNGEGIYIPMATTSGYPVPRASMFMFGICRSTNTRLLGYKNSKEGCYYFFYYVHAQGKFWPHDCDKCQPVIKEASLNPLYAEYDDLLRQKVLFVKNRITSKVEQYKFDMDTGVLTQVKRPSMVYSASKVVDKTAVIGVWKSKNGKDTVMIERSTTSSLRKVKINGEKTEIMAECPLVRLSTPPILEEHRCQNYPELSQMEQDYCGFLSSAIPFISYFCPHTQQELLKTYNKVQHKYIQYYYNENEGVFYDLPCKMCMIAPVERDLIPKYAEKYEGKWVIMAQNAHTIHVEQFIFNGETLSFEQVYYPGLRYDQAKDSASWVIHCGEYNGKQTIIMKDGMYRIRKEQFSTEKNKYVAIAGNPVKRLLIKHDEPEKPTTVPVQKPAQAAQKPSNSNDSEDIIHVATILPKFKNGEIQRNLNLAAELGQDWKEQELEMDEDFEALKIRNFETLGIFEMKDPDSDDGESMNSMEAQGIPETSTAIKKGKNNKKNKKKKRGPGYAIPGQK